MSKVFISYRRADSADRVKKLYRHLSLRYGKDLIFQDIEDISPGEMWLDTIRKELMSCQVTLVIIGSWWLIDKNGVSRFKNPKDVLMMEIHEALSSKSIVIPVLLGNANMPSAKDLPKQLRPITERQAIRLREKQWNNDVRSLIEHLSNLVMPSIGKLSLTDTQHEVYEMQLRYFELLDNESASDALEQAQKTQAFLDRLLPVFPQDPYLKMTRGYLFKNEAMALLRLFNRNEEAAVALDQGESIFRTMIDENPDDAGAWNGLGSIEAVRGNYGNAHEYIDKALMILPDYVEAKQDHEEVLKQLGLKDCNVIKSLKKKSHYKKI